MDAKSLDHVIGQIIGYVKLSEERVEIGFKNGEVVCFEKVGTEKILIHIPNIAYLISAEVTRVTVSLELFEGKERTEITIFNSSQYIKVVYLKEIPNRRENHEEIGEYNGK